MRSVLWCLLVFSTSDLTLGEDTGSNDLFSSSELRPLMSELADVIYDKQKVCDSIFGEAVVKTLEKDNTDKLLVPDERYLQCMKTLDEKKREYIKTVLGGLNHYTYVFPMRLSNKQLVHLPVPPDEISSSLSAPEFDIQQELCVTNKLCITLIRLQFSNDNVEDLNEQKKHVARCLDFLNDLKLKYVEMKKIKENELKKGDALTLMCTDGSLTLTPPEKKTNVADTSSPSVASETPKTEPAAENDKEGKDSTTAIPENSPYKGLYDEVVKELNSRFEEQSKNQKISDQDFENEIPLSEPGNSLASASEEPAKDEMITNDDPILQDVDVTDKINDDTNGNQDAISEHPENEMAFSDKAQEEEIAKSEPSNGDCSSHEFNLSDTNKAEDIQAVTQGTAIKENVPVLEDTETVPGNEDEVKHKKEYATNIKLEKKRRQKPKHDKNVELLTYRVKFLTKNVDGKTVKIQASGRIKKTESASPTSNLQGLSSAVDGVENKSDLGLVDLPTEDNNSKRRHPDSLEENIILVEHDCKELLQFGERLLQHKMLSSLVHLENHYNECIRKLDDLKKIYIEKHHLDVMSHKNIFSLTLPSGDPKLVLLPVQFLKTDSAESKSSNLTPGDQLDLAEFFSKNDKTENPTWKQREPFDDPAFISNDEFLEGLKQGAAPSDSSTLSKVASILHMNGGHMERKISE